MAIDRPPAGAKRERAIPVKVLIDPRPAPTIHPPLAPLDAALKPALVRPPKKKSSAGLKPLMLLRQPIHEWPEEKRRRLMWWLVGGGTLAVMIGWLAVVRFELRGGQGPNLFAETLRLLKTVRWPGTEQPSSAAEQEIRQLDKEVFPKFTQ